MHIIVKWTRYKQMFIKTWDQGIIWLCDGFINKRQENKLKSRDMIHRVKLFGIFCAATNIY